MNRLLLSAMLTLLAGCGEPPITVICPWGAGGGTDRISRYWADSLQQRLERPVVVVNRTGGSGASGHTAGASAAPDGNTLTMITFELSTMHRMGISPLTHEDFQPLLQVNADPAAIIVQQNGKWETLGELLDYIRENPGEVRMSGTASGGAWDLARAGLLRAASLPVDSVIWVPTNGAAASLNDLLGGHLEAVCCSIPEAANSIEAGELLPLAVMSQQRLDDHPRLPTCQEQGVDWVMTGWRGLALPQGAPPQIVAPLEAACLEIAESDDYRSFMENNGFGVEIRGAEAFREFLIEQDEKWKQVVEAAGYAAP